MKKMLYKAMALMLSMAMCVSFVSCGDDDDEPAVVDPTIVAVTANYVVALSNDYYSLWDVQVTYTTASGTKTEPITADWSKTETFTDANALPSSVVFSVEAKPKSTVPTLVDDQIYSLAAAYSVSVFGLKSDGSTAALADKSNSATLYAQGSNSKLLDYLNNGRTVCDYSVDLNY
jgi:hypothetical protein